MKTLTLTLTILGFVLWSGVALADAPVGPTVDPVLTELNVSTLASDEQLCRFSASAPVDGDKLEAPVPIRMTGDECSVFKIYVGVPASEDLAVAGFEDDQAFVIPRANIYEEQSCRFSNVLTQAKIEEYALAVLPDEGTDENEELARFIGVCGHMEVLVEGEPSEFVKEAYEQRDWRVDRD